MMRDDSDSGGFAKILSVSVAASAKLAKERPAAPLEYLAQFFLAAHKEEMERSGAGE